MRVLDCMGFGSMSNIIAGMDWVAANRVRPAVANISIVGGVSAALNDAVTVLREQRDRYAQQVMMYAPTPKPFETEQYEILTTRKR